MCVCYIHSIQTWVCCLSCMKNWARASSSRIRCTCHMARLSLWAASSDRRLYWSISSFLQCGCSNTRVTNKCCWIRVSSRGTCSKCIPKKGFCHIKLQLTIMLVDKMIISISENQRGCLQMPLLQVIFSGSNLPPWFHGIALFNPRSFSHQGALHQIASN